MRLLDFTLSGIFCQFHCDIAKPIALLLQISIAHSSVAASWKLYWAKRFLLCTFWLNSSLLNIFVKIKSQLHVLLKLNISIDKEVFSYNTGLHLCQYAYISQLLSCHVFRRKYRYYFLVIELNESITTVTTRKGFSLSFLQLLT